MQFLAGLTKPLHSLPGIGPRTAARLAKAGIRQQRDLLLLLPREYQDRRRFSMISASDGVRPGAYRVRVVEHRRLRLHNGKLLLKIFVHDGRTVGELLCFNRAFLADRLPPGTEIDLFGVFAYKNNSWQCASFDYLPAGGEGSYREFGMIVPVYPLTAGVTQKMLRKAVRFLLESMPEIPEVMPEYLQKRRELLPLCEALPAVHFPEDETVLRRARESLAYAEFFLFEAGLRYARAVRVAENKPRRYREDLPLERLESRFGFSLTDDQRRAYDEICTDLLSPVPMQRLLMGDVGCGKTAVAAAAVYRAVFSGFQAAVAAPTGVLAAQLAERLAHYLEPLGVRCGLLTGRLAPAQRRQLLDRLASGELQLVTGTHALFSEAVEYAALGLVVIDEQHRFGVNHRRALLAKGRGVDYLAMSATPIPRSLAMTLYGGFDMSIIRQVPAGRQPVTTRLLEQDPGPAYADLEERLRRGEQGFVVFPLVEERETSDLAAAEQGFHELCNSPLGRHGIGLLHGRLSEEEKADAMEKFKRGETGVLCATTVVEVGVDNPRATVMIVREAQRFGLSQLHQLRGRVGRGDRPSVCWLVTGACGEECQRRMAVMLRCRDGFRIAEEDLALRGPGDYFGVSQTGLPEFRTADPVARADLLEIARKDAYFILDRDPRLFNEHNRALQQAIELEQHNGGGL